MLPSSGLLHFSCFPLSRYLMYVCVLLLPLFKGQILSSLLLTLVSSSSSLTPRPSSSSLVFSLPANCFLSASFFSLLVHPYSQQPCFSHYPKVHTVAFADPCGSRACFGNQVQQATWLFHRHVRRWCCQPRAGTYTLHTGCYVMP